MAVRLTLEQPKFMLIFIVCISCHVLYCVVLLGVSVLNIGCYKIHQNLTDRSIVHSCVLAQALGKLSSLRKLFQLELAAGDTELQLLRDTALVTYVHGILLHHLDVTKKDKAKLRGYVVDAFSVLESAQLEQGRVLVPGVLQACQKAIHLKY